MRQFVSHLSDGDSVQETFLVSEKQLRANRNGNLYLQLELRDRSGVISARMWNASDSLHRSFEQGDFVSVAGKVQIYQGALQMIVNDVNPVARERVDLADFLPHAPRNLDELFSRVKHVLLSVSNLHLRSLAECFLIDEEFVQKFMAAPAGIKHHHAYLGGLLEHVCTLLEAANRILDLYPAIDRDLLLLGVFLHDLGKIHELGYERAFEYTDEGQLVGHVVIAVEMLNEKVAQTVELTGEPFPKEALLRLKHMILSHHGSYEYGSPKLPMTPEAVALHHLDNLDAKVHNFDQQIREDPNPDSAWTSYNPSLGRKLFKGAGRDNRDEPSTAEPQPTRSAEPPALSRQS